MKRTIQLLLFLALVSGMVWAQGTIVQGTITGSGCLTIDVTGKGVVGISVTNSGTAWSGTIQPEIAIGGDAAQNTTVTPYNSTTSQSTITANGVYQSFVSGATTFLACGNTVTNTASVKLQVVNLSAGSRGAGGFAGASLTGCIGTLNNLTCPEFTATTGGFQSNLQNGGWQLVLGNGSQSGASVGNAVLYGNNSVTNPCVEEVVATIDQGCEITSGLQIPSIDRSIGMTTAAMGAQSSATLTPVTGMIWNLVASKNYAGWCEIPVTFAASATIAFGLVGPGTPTSYNIDAYGLIGAAAVYGDISLQGQTTWATTKTGASGAPGTNVTEVVHVNFELQNGTTAGLLTLDTAANGTNTITVGANAICHVMQQN